MAWFNAWFSPIDETGSNGLILAMQELDLGALFADPAFRNECRQQLQHLGCPKPVDLIIIAALVPVISKTGKLVSQHAVTRLARLLSVNKSTKKFAEWLVNTIGTANNKLELRDQIKQQIETGTYAHMQVRTNSTWSTAELAKLNIQNALAGLHKSLRDLADQMTSLFDDQNAPQFQHLETQPEHVSSALRFHFKSRVDQFVGRQKELDFINSFLLEPRGDDRLNRFRWQLLYAEGGTGKSRLALEALRRAGPAWRCGFIDIKNSIDNHYAAWRPSEPTFMVIDYAAQHPDAVGQFISALTGNAAHYDYPVRLLLLERSASGQWYDDLFDAAKGGAALARCAARYAEPQSIGAIEDTDLIALMRARIKTAQEGQNDAPGAPDDAALIKTLTSVDARKRPLFAAMLADAIGLGDDPGTITREGVIDRFLKREEKQYWHIGDNREKTAAHKNLLALATLCLGLKRDALPEGGWPEAANLPDFAREGHGSFFAPALYAAMSGEDPAVRLAPLLPDLAGEYFVLKLLAAGPKSKRRALVDLAWGLDGPGMASFLLLAARDYAQKLPDLGYLAPGEAAGAKAPLWFAYVQVDLITVLAQSGRLDDARAIHSLVVKTAQTSGNAEGLVLTAMGAVNLINAYGNANDLPTAKKLYDWLRDTAQSSRNAEVLVLAANGAFNLICFYVIANDLKLAERLYTWLCNTAKLSCNAEVLVWAAKGAVNLISTYGNAKYLPAAERLYAWLREAAESSGNEEVLIEAAKGAYNLSLKCIHVKYLEMAEKLCSWLHNAAKESGNTEVLVEAAKGAANLILAYGNADDLPAAEKLYDLLRDATKTSRNTEVLVLAAKGAVNLILAYINAEDLPAAEKLHTWLRESAQSSGNAKEQVIAAEGAVILIDAYGNANELKAAEKLYKWLRETANVSGKEDVLIETSKGVGNLYLSGAKADDADFAREVASSTMGLFRHGLRNNNELITGTAFAILKKIAADWPEDENIRALRDKAQSEGGAG